MYLDIYLMVKVGPLPLGEDCFMILNTLTKLIFQMIGI